MHLAIKFYRPNTLALNGAEIALSLAIIMVFSDVFLESLLKGSKENAVRHKHIYPRCYQLLTSTF